MNVKITTCLTGVLALAFSPQSMRADHIVQTNLVSDVQGMAAITDANLVNPWGIAHGPTPWWVSDNGTGVSTIYGGDGGKKPLTVTIPPSGGSAPTGIVFNATSDFMLAGAKSLFIFVSEDGRISAWN